MAFEGPIESFPEHGRPREQLIARARQLEWYHTLELDSAFTTEGIFSLDEFVPYYLLPESLAGLDCLDVGTGNGYWAFQMEKRKARSVVATDIGDYFHTDFSVLHGRAPLSPAPSPSGAYGEPFRLAATLLGSGVRYAIRSAYDLTPQSTGTFDLVFCGSLLMHLFAPLLALHRIAGVCRDALILTSQTDLALDGEPLVRYRGREIPYVHFLPSPSCLVDMLVACGYQKVLRGPTFFLRFRDRERNPDALVHTTLVALKDVDASRLRLPRPREYSREERLCGIEIVSAPGEAAPGAVFDVLVRVSNRSLVPWRGDGPGIELMLGIECAFGQGGVRSSRWTAASRTCSVDYLPPQLSTLARVEVAAPGSEGLLEIRPVVLQGSNRFSGCDPTALVRVVRRQSPSARRHRFAIELGTLRPSSGLRSRAVDLVRRVDAMLQARLGARSGGRWYTRIRATLKRAIRALRPA
jgi:SAM-dependent methyltransferase